MDEPVDLGAYIQEDVQERIIYDQHEKGSQLALAPNGAFAMMTKRKIHVLWPRLRYMSAFRCDWILLSESKDAFTYKEEASSLQLWLKMQNIKENPQFVQVDWLLESFEGKYNFLLVVVASGGSLLVLRPMHNSVSTTVPLYYAQMVATGFDIAFNSMADDKFQAFGPVSCVSLSSRTSSMVSLHSAGQVVLSVWTHTLSVALALTTADMVSLGYLNPHDSEVQKVSFHESGLLMIGTLNSAVLIHMHFDSVTGAVSSQRRVTRIEVEGLLIAIHASATQCCALSSHHAHVITVTQDALAHHTHRISLPDAVDVSALRLYSPLLSTSIPEACWMTSSHAGSISFWSVRVDGVSDTPTLASHGAWTSSKATHGVTDVLADPVSATLFSVYRVPPALDNSRETQINRQSGRPQLALRTLPCPVYPTDWLLHLPSTTWTLLQWQRRSSRQRQQSLAYLVIQLQCTLPEIRARFANSPLIPLPDTIHKAQQFHEANKDNPDALYQSSRKLYGNRRGSGGSGNVDEDGEEYVDEDDENDTSDSEAGEPSVKKSKTSAKGPAKSRGKGAKSRSAASADDGVGFGLDRMFRKMWSYMPPDPVVLATRVMNSFVLAATLAAALQQRASSLDMQAWVSSEDIATASQTLCTDVLQGLFAADARATWRKLLLCIPTDWEGVREHIILLQVLHVLLQGLRSVYDVQSAAMTTELRDTLSSVEQHLIVLHTMYMVHSITSHMNTSTMQSLSAEQTADLTYFLQRSHQLLLRQEGIMTSSLLQSLDQVVQQSLRSVSGSGSMHVHDDDTCDICQQPLTFDAENTPSKSFCGTCGIFIERCVFTWRPVTHGTHNMHSITRLVECTVCGLVSNDHQLHKQMELMQLLGCSEDMQLSAMRSGFCSCCHLQMLPL